MIIWLSRDQATFFNTTNTCIPMSLLLENVQNHWRRTQQIDPSKIPNKRYSKYNQFEWLVLWVYNSSLVITMCQTNTASSSFAAAAQHRYIFILLFLKTKLRFPLNCFEFFSAYEKQVEQWALLLMLSQIII